MKQQEQFNQEPEEDFSQEIVEIFTSIFNFVIGKHIKNKPSRLLFVIGELWVLSTAFQLLDKIVDFLNYVIWG